MSGVREWLGEHVLRPMVLGHKWRLCAGLLFWSQCDMCGPLPAWLYSDWTCLLIPLPSCMLPIVPDTVYCSWVLLGMTLVALLTSVKLLTCVGLCLGSAFVDLSTVFFPQYLLCTHCQLCCTVLAGYLPSSTFNACSAAPALRPGMLLVTQQTACRCWLLCLTRQTVNGTNQQGILVSVDMC